MRATGIDTATSHCEWYWDAGQICGYGMDDDGFGSEGPITDFGGDVNGTVCAPGTECGGGTGDWAGGCNVDGCSFWNPFYECKFCRCASCQAKGKSCQTFPGGVWEQRNNCCPGLTCAGDTDGPLSGDSGWGTGTCT